MLTDLTVTSGGDARIASPVVKSASYNFVAGDVNAWLYISSGTSWTPGWYQIASVASNEATLSAAAGAGYLSVNKDPTSVTAAAGVATVQTPTSGTWTIDYSQQAAAQFTYTDLASVGAGLLVSSAAQPFGKQQVGNALVITGGTNFTAGRYVIASIGVANVATVVGPGNVTTGAGVNGTGGLGGALATPGQAGAVKIAGHDIFMKAATYSLSGNTANTAGCQINETTGGVDQTNPTWWVGWDTVRTLYNTNATWPSLNANAQTSLTLFIISGSYTRVRNLIVDGNAKSSLTGVLQNANYQKIDHIKAQNCTVVGIDINGGNNVSSWSLSATACSGTAAIRLSGNAVCYYSEAWANTIHGFSCSNGTRMVGCIAYLNTATGAAGGGGNIDGFTSSSIGFDALYCVAYGNGRTGFDASGSVGNQLFVNCIAEANGGAGWSTGAVRGMVGLVNCGGYNNTSGNFTAANLLDSLNFVANTTGSFFTNAAAGDFSLNNTANQGALARAAGFPGVMPRGTTTGYLDIGVAQHQDSGGSGGVTAPTMIYGAEGVQVG